MESLPPMAPTPRSIWAMSAPSSAATGLPQRSGSWPQLLEVLLEGEVQCSPCSKPAATSLATDSITAM